jgi:hypothetical protein
MNMVAYCWSHAELCSHIPLGIEDLLHDAFFCANAK